MAQPTTEQAMALVQAVKAMRETALAIFEGGTDQYHSDTLRDAAEALCKTFGITFDRDPEIPRRD